MPYGTFGNATTSHLYGELLKKNADIDMTHVPYRGSAPLTERPARQHGDRGFRRPDHGQRANQGGQAQGAGGRRRKAQDRSCPTCRRSAELGYPGFEIEGWIGVFVPAATPKDIVTKLSAELARIIASPEGVAGIEALSLIPVGGSAEAFDKVLRRDLREMGRCREGNRRQGRLSRASAGFAYRHSGFAPSRAPE